MFVKTVPLAALLVSWPLVSFIVHAQDVTKLPSQRRPDSAIAVKMVAESDGTWKKVQARDDTLTSRELFTYALALCESKTQLERLETLFDVAAQMQDRNATSKGYGNFRWSWRDTSVIDFNAVDFCMQGGSLMWLRDQKIMPAAARDKLKTLIDFAVEGSMRHRVNASYTNIALMNAGNLILLGETLSLPKVADEGYSRLDGVVLDINEHGIAEYASPTYYGVDVECLGTIATFAQRERGKTQARALLELFWSDIAWNWAPSQKLGGARSRDYDYLRGIGLLDAALWLQGWLREDKPNNGGLIIALSSWHPDDKLWTIANGQFPRNVYARWNADEWKTRTQYIEHDIALGSASANYHTMDIPLSVDFAGDRNAPRAYFIPDGRHDPYGKVAIAESAAHSKTLHLRPFWTAVQKKNDVLALAVYRDADIPEGTQTLESHWVMPTKDSTFWIDDKPVDLSKPISLPVKIGQSVFLRRGGATLGVQVLAARANDGKDAIITLQNDGNSFGVVRLTVDHKITSTRGNFPAVALRVRSGSDLGSDAKFERWRFDFMNLKSEVTANPTQFSLRSPASKGALVIEAKAPFSMPEALQPAPRDAVLELDGRDVGRDLLRDVEPVRSLAKIEAAMPLVRVASKGSTFWEASTATLGAPMQPQDDGAEKYIWTPGEIGAQGGGAGRASWKLNLPTAGKYFVWGRVLSPTPDDDSFFVRWKSGNRSLSPNTTWALGVNSKWSWVRLMPENTDNKTVAGWDFPAGEVKLELSTREDGAKISRWFITTNADATPDGTH